MVKNYQVQRPQRSKHPRPPKPTLDDIHFSPPIHITGTGVKGYWIVIKHLQSSGGSETDNVRVEDDGTYRAINPLLNPSIGDTVIVAQAAHEFDDEKDWSEKVEKKIIE